ncbi:DUF294 nucleotidyltransferase-like domain-containing protein [Salisediminibacterium beveridgei]|uniref:CBS Domain-Containing Protein n=1 Tax=Salisediminibacterium beveridgei TaxID=632773 RepID=A0A1D7QVM2_9BACI|nr:DUF294 nucleotidyltransferase-like domain-containing protein [Salisediminibacterium beveridgei]AOM83008.1 CBS Domain-Containing Protein [Salisediminibacterium beveridgei]
MDMGTASNPTFHSFESIRDWFHPLIESDNISLSDLHGSHEQCLQSVLSLAQRDQKRARGEAPAPFVFFVMGSAGRMEQARFSDQDHGIFFEGQEGNQTYFLELGERIAEGLAICGYPLCEGKIMASEERWCKNEQGWEKQLQDWIEEDTWESMRYLTIFLDSRVISGDPDFFLSFKKQLMEDTMSNNPRVVKRLADNVGHRKKGKGVLGQFFTEQKGEYKGLLDFRETVLFPYVHAARILAFSYAITDASTINRFIALQNHLEQTEKIKESFHSALQFRLKHHQGSTRNSTHYLDPALWSTEEKKQVRYWMKTGKQTLDDAIRHAEYKGG